MSANDMAEKLARRLRDIMGEFNDDCVGVEILVRQLADYRRAHLTQPAQSVDVERLLAALGHIRVPNTDCLARVAKTPPQLRPPGPHNPPIWCCLPAGHDGPHRHDGGGMYHSIPFREKDEVVMGDPLPDHCEKCRHIWPCDDAKTITAAICDATREASR